VRTKKKTVRAKKHAYKNHAYKKQNHAYKTHGSKPCVLSKRCVFIVPQCWSSTHYYDQIYHDVAHHIARWAPTRGTRQQRLYFDTCHPQKKARSGSGFRGPSRGSRILNFKIKIKISDHISTDNEVPVPVIRVIWYPE
jgi:hypothetical protein